MQLTSFTDYGLRALIYMASLPEGRMTSISEVTDVYGVSRNHMVKIINQLSRAGYVTAVRGKNGGIRLGKPASAIRIGDVVRELEPCLLYTSAQHTLRLPPQEGRLRSRFYQLQAIEKEWMEEDGSVSLQVRMPIVDWRRLCKQEPALIDYLI